MIDNGYEQEAAYAQLQAAGLVTYGRPQILQDGTVRSFWDCLQNNMQQGGAFTTRLDGVFAVFNSWITSGQPGFGIPASNVNSLTYGGAYVPVMKVEEGYAFDLKFDDGLPLTGRIMMYNVSTASGYCVSNNTTAATYYMTTANTMSCYMMMAL